MCACVRPFRFQKGAAGPRRFSLREGLEKKEGGTAVGRPDACDVIWYDSAKKHAPGILSNGCNQWHFGGAAQMSSSLSIVPRLGWMNGAGVAYGGLHHIA
jgi:hypothetical protein